MSSPTIEEPPALREDEYVTEQYADGIAECTFLNGVLHISFWTLRTDCSMEPPRYYRKVTLRLVVPIAGAIELHERVAKMLEALEGRGTIQRSATSPLQIMSGPQTRQ